eukprot:11191695-Lingulodinium_polyedra.AAC.1
MNPSCGGLGNPCAISWNAGGTHLCQSNARGALNSKTHPRWLLRKYARAIPNTDPTKLLLRPVAMLLLALV